MDAGRRPGLREPHLEHAAPRSGDEPDIPPGVDHRGRFDNVFCLAFMGPYHSPPYNRIKPIKAKKIQSARMKPSSVFYIGLPVETADLSEFGASPCGPQSVLATGIIVV